MANEPAVLSSRDQRIDEAIAVYLEAVDLGHAPDRREFLARYSDLATELEEFLADHDGIDRLIEPHRQASVEGRSPGGQADRAEWDPESVDHTADFGKSGGSSSSPRLPNIGPNYEVLEEIGRGGMGDVYKAWDRQLNRVVALKMIRADRLMSTADIQRFRFEAEAVAHLDHPNIVPVYYLGEYRGQLFFSMKLIDGGGLDKRLTRFRDDPRKAAQLVVTIARAMHYAHERGIRHRDLKPSNILLDVEDRPYIADFGLVHRDEDASELTATGEIVGSAPYMAPEQASGGKEAITTATDIYGLGATLFELLTGRPPFVGETRSEILRRVQESEPEKPRMLNPAVDRDLEAICLKCLNKAKNERYGSADAVANDLERWLAGKPVLARPIGGAERFGRWWRRQPAAAGLVIGAIVLLITVVVTALGIARDLAAWQQNEVLRNNVYAANGVASTVLWELREVSELVLRLAENATLQNLLKQGNEPGLQRFLDQNPPVDTRVTNWNVFDSEGRQMAVSPRHGTDMGADYSWRDYFRGAELRQEKTGLASMYISRVYQSHTDDYYKIAISVSVRDATGLIGVITATIKTTPQLGSLSLSDARRKFVLVGRRDPNLEQGGSVADGPPEHLILVHPEYQLGQVPVTVPNEKILQITKPRPGDVFHRPPSHPVDAPAYQDPDYRDPLYGDRWLAGFAQVGNTELVVIVQQRYSEVVEPYASRARDHILLSGGVLSLVVLSLGGYLWYGIQKASSRHRPHRTATVGI